MSLSLIGQGDRSDDSDIDVRSEKTAWKTTKHGQSRALKISCQHIVGVLAIVIAIFAVGAVFWIKLEMESQLASFKDGNSQLKEQQGDGQTGAAQALKSSFTKEHLQRNYTILQRMVESYQDAIDSSLIAHYYGEPEELIKERPVSSALRLLDVNPPKPLARCHRVRQNQHQQWWCYTKNKSGKHPDDHWFGTSNKLASYPYFKEADWMSEPGSKRYYTRENDGWIQIKTNGTYMVYANIQFQDTSSSNPYYKIELRRGADDVRITLCSCVAVASIEPDNMDSLTCFTQVPTMLHAGDQVNMLIQSHFLFRVTKENFYFGLIRLNSHTV